MVYHTLHTHLCTVDHTLHTREDIYLLIDSVQLAAHTRLWLWLRRPFLNIPRTDSLVSSSRGFFNNVLMYASMSSSISSAMMVNTCVIISASVFDGFLIFDGFLVVGGDFVVGGLVFQWCCLLFLILVLVFVCVWLIFGCNGWNCLVVLVLMVSTKMLGCL